MKIINKIHNGLAQYRLNKHHPDGVKADSKPIIERLFKCSVEGDYAQVDFLIDLLLTHVYHGLSKAHKTLLRDVARAICKCEIDYEETRSVQERLVSETRVLDPKVLTLPAWLGLQYFFIRLGLFQSSVSVREKAYARAEADAASGSKGRVEKYLFALIDRGDFSKATAVLQSLSAKVTDERYTVLSNYLAISSGGKPHMEPKSRIEEAYAKYIQGKSIAIVGPSPSGARNGDEIDDHDIVIRLGYKGSIVNEEDFGSRTDLTYYAIANVIYYLKDQNCEFLEDLDFVSFKSSNFKEHASDELLAKSRIFRRNRYYFCGSPTMAQHALHDLLHFEPASIKMFNMNFYLAQKKYYDGYIPTKKQRAVYLNNVSNKYYNLWAGQDTDTAGFAHHDMLSSINFFRNTMHREGVVVDDVCAKILSLTSREYFKGLEARYVQPFMTVGNKWQD